MSDPKNLSPKRAAQYAAFQDLKRRRAEAIDAVWRRAKSCCETCGMKVSRPDQTIHAKTASFLVFDDPAHPTADTGHLRCGRHYVRP